jgi:hypothetical protein
MIPLGEAVPVGESLCPIGAKGMPVADPYARRAPLAMTNPPAGGVDHEPKTEGMSSAKLIHKVFTIS